MALPIEGADYFVRMMRLPGNVRGAIRLNSDNTFSVYLNPDYCREEQIDSYEHELWHIIHDDLYGEKNVMDLEFKKGA